MLLVFVMANESSEEIEEIAENNVAHPNHVQPFELEFVEWVLCYWLELLNVSKTERPEYKLYVVGMTYDLVTFPICACLWLERRGRGLHQCWLHLFRSMQNVKGFNFYSIHAQAHIYI